MIVTRTKLKVKNIYNEILVKNIYNAWFQFNAFAILLFTQQTLLNREYELLI